MEAVVRRIMPFLPHVSTHRMTYMTWRVIFSQIICLSLDQVRVPPCVNIPMEKGDVKQDSVLSAGAAGEKRGIIIKSALPISIKPETRGDMTPPEQPGRV